MAINTIYIRNLPGIVRLIQIICLFTSFIAVFANNCYDRQRRGWWGFCCWGGMITSVAFYVIHLFFIPVKVPAVPWRFLEVFEQAWWALCCLIGASLIASTAGWCWTKAGLIIGAILGFIALIAFVVGAILALLSWKAVGFAMQVHETHSTQQTTVTVVSSSQQPPPTYDNATKY